MLVKLRNENASNSGGAAYSHLQNDPHPYIEMQAQNAYTAPAPVIGQAVQMQMQEPPPQPQQVQVQAHQTPPQPLQQAQPLQASPPVVMLRQNSASPITNFSDSNFLKMYDRCNAQTLPQWWQYLLSEVRRELDQKVVEGRTEGEATVWLWTKEDPLRYSNLDGDDAVYRTMQNAIISDKEAPLRRFMYLIRVINTFLVTRPTPQSYLAYRASSMTKEQLLQIMPGNQYCLRMYAAISTEQAMAFGCMQRESRRVLLVFQIPQGCRNACDIHSVSKYEHEAEILIPPYTAVECTSIEDMPYGKAVHMTVLENLSSPLTLQIIHA